MFMPHIDSTHSILCLFVWCGGCFFFPSSFYCILLYLTLTSVRHQYSHRRYRFRHNECNFACFQARYKHTEFPMLVHNKHACNQCAEKKDKWREKKKFNDSNEHGDREKRKSIYIIWQWEQNWLEKLTFASSNNNSDSWYISAFPICLYRQRIKNVKRSIVRWNMQNKEEKIKLSVSNKHPYSYAYWCGSIINYGGSRHNSDHTISFRL